jgi:uncharacterized protein
MSRLLFLLGVAALVYWLLKRYRNQPPKVDTPVSSEDMVSCAQCGVHQPKSESVASGNQHFCCDEHRRQYESK